MPFAVKSGLSPHSPLRRPLHISPPGKGEACAYKSGTRYVHNPLCDRRTTSPRCCRVDPKGDRRGAAQRGRVRDLPTYLPLLYYGDTAITRIRVTRKPLSIPQHAVRRDRSPGIMRRLALSVITSRVSRALGSLFFIATGYYAV